MEKVLVIGCSGAGKSTFARRLRDATGLPLYYLDMLWHRPDKTTVSREEFDASLAEILKKDRWIIDGNFSRTFETRLKECDTVFLFDLPLEDCIAGVESRIGTKREDMPWVETEFDPEFRRWMESFPEKVLPKMYALLDKYRGRNLIVFHSREEVESYKLPASGLFQPLFAALGERLSAGPAVLAIDGGSASGKTTLGGVLAERYGATVFHMDDFFLRPEQRTAQRFAEPGGNVDRERFLSEVLLPLRRGETVSYRRFDCATMQLLPAVPVAPKRLVVVEGAYSMHPELAPYYDLSAFLDIAPALQRERILRRNTPEKARRFFSDWIPMEQKYFAAFGIPERCTLSISIQ